MGQGDHAADNATENFTELIVQEAKIEDLYDEKKQKIQLTFFLIKLLHEFRTQDVSNAVEAQHTRKDIISNFQQTPDGNMTPIDLIAEDTEESPTRPAGASIIG